jgi:hypothetical protein
MPPSASPLHEAIVANSDAADDDAVENVSDRVVANDTGDDDDSEPMPIAPPPPPVDDDDDDQITQNNDNNDTKLENGADSPINDDADAVVENGSLAVHATLDGSQIVELTDVNDDDDDDDDDNNNNNDNNSNNDHAPSAEVVGPESPRAPKGVLCIYCYCFTQRHKYRREFTNGEQIKSNHSTHLRSISERQWHGGRLQRHCKLATL